MTTTIDQTTQQAVRFTLPRKQLLNSNVAVHVMAKSKIVRELRALAAEEGLTYHEGENRDNAILRYSAIQEERRIALEKSRLVKRANKNIKKAVTEEEQNELKIRLEEQLEDFDTVLPSLDSFGVDFLYDLVHVTATIYPPTRRHIDPPNLWPTVKALLDGLTDASWWEDDDFTHVVETSFRYGGLSGVSNEYIIELSFQEVDNTSGEYITSPDQSRIGV